MFGYRAEGEPMDLQWSAADSAFRDEVREFLDGS